MKNTLKTDLNEYAKELKNAPMVDDSHFYDFRNNIFEGKMSEEFVKMFMEGDGSELISKACAVHSSSILGYNFFHWISESKPFTIKFFDKEVSYTNVRFEVKMRVLKRSSRSANMDIVLTNKNGDILFIESKFLEYLNSGKFSISETYQKADSYYSFGSEWSSFISGIKSVYNDKNQYYEGIKQEITHAIALNNWANGNTVIDVVSPYNEKKDNRFINLVFKPNEKYGKESEAFSNYEKLYGKFHDELKEKGLIPLGIQMFFMSYSDIWPSLINCVSMELRQYLYDHYMKFSYRIQ